MKQIKILGSGCRNCEITANVIAQAAREAGVEVGDREGNGRRRDHGLRGDVDARRGRRRQVGACRWHTRAGCSAGLGAGVT